MRHLSDRLLNLLAVVLTGIALVAVVSAYHNADVGRDTDVLANQQSQADYRREVDRRYRWIINSIGAIAKHQGIPLDPPPPFPPLPQMHGTVDR